MPFWRLHRRPKHHVTHLESGERHMQYAGQAVLASAALVSKERVRSVMSRKSDWQGDAWDLYDTVSELRFGVSWVANACSRARLYVGKIDPDGSSDPVPVGMSDKDGDDDNVLDLSPEMVKRLQAPLKELGGGQLGQSEMLRRLSILLNIPGEGYIVGFDNPDSGNSRTWLVASPDEIQTTGGSVRLQLPDLPSNFAEINPDTSTILRIWRPHPRYGYLPDSPLITLRQPLRELVDISAHITATAESRLAGAGVLFVPDELTIPAPEQSDGANPIHSDPFTASLIEAMAAPLKNRDSASAVVPLVVRGPADKGKEIKHLTFATPFDAQAREMRESAIKRVAAGMDMPPEVLLGMGDTNHWSAWQIEESAIKLHIEPLLGLICDAITANLYQPILRAMGVDDYQNWAIWYDTSELTLRPNRGPEALQAFQQNLISESATRRELGFSDEDEPSKEERARRLATQVALTNANLAPFILPELGVDLPEGAGQPEGTPAPLTAPTNTTRMPGLPTTDTQTGQRPALPTEQSSITFAWRRRCLDMAVRRALQHCGNFLLAQNSRAFKAQLKDVPLHEIHVHLPADRDQLNRMLANAYREFHASTPGQTCLHQAVDHYIRALILAREPHHRDYLDRAISQFGCEEPEEGSPHAIT